MKYWIHNENVIVVFKKGARPKKQLTKCKMLYSCDGSIITAVNKDFGRYLKKWEIVKYKMLGYI